MKTLSGITKPAKGMVLTIFTIHTRSQEVQVDAENGGGWALPLSKKKMTRFSENQKNYLKSKFQVSEESGLQLDPAKSCPRYAIRPKCRGRKTFQHQRIPDCPTSAVFFSRRVSKQLHA